MKRCGEKLNTWSTSVEMDSWTTLVPAENDINLDLEISGGDSPNRWQDFDVYLGPDEVDIREGEA
jgi:hypothetical protein